MSILLKVVEDLSKDPRVTREQMEHWISEQKIHEFDDGVVFERKNELHIHFYTKSWFKVKRYLTEVIRPLLKKYDYVWTISDIPNAQRALVLFGAIQHGEKFILTRERFKNVWCK